jgi:hypothetical protein
MKYHLAVDVVQDQHGRLLIEELNNLLENGEGWLVVFTECGGGDMLVIVERQTPDDKDKTDA